MISEWLYGFPVTSTVLLFGLGGGALLAAAPVLREKLFRVKTSREYSSVARNTLTVIIGVMGTLLAFSLVQADANLRQIQKDVGAEAHDLAQMDRLLVRYGQPSAASIRISLHDYANSILVDEWPQLSHRRQSERTRSLFPPISRGVMALQPTTDRETVIYTEILKKADDREGRLVAAAELTLPPIFWKTMVFLFCGLLVLSPFCETSSVQLVALWIEGFGLCLLISLVFLVDHPFKGRLAVSPNPIVKVVKEMQSRTE